jgi:hypothetical protein
MYSDARGALHQTLMSRCQYFPNPSFYDYALYLKLEIGFSWFDALIIVAASASGRATLLTKG